MEGTMVVVHGTLLGRFKPTTIILPSYIINHHATQSKISVILLAEGMYSGVPDKYIIYTLFI